MQRPLLGTSIQSKMSRLTKPRRPRQRHAMFALAGGQQRALRRLLERLTLAADHRRLPNVAKNAIAELVEGIEVSEEKTSPTRYIATLGVTFKKGRIRSLLRGHGVSFSGDSLEAVAAIAGLSRRGCCAFVAGSESLARCLVKRDRQFGCASASRRSGRRTRRCCCDQRNTSPSRG